MNDDLIRRSDAINAVWGDDINPSEEGAVFEAQSHIDRDIRLVPSADIDLSEYSDKLWKTAYERGKADRPQGEWIDKAISIIDDMRKEGIVDYEQAREFRMRARMKGADDDSKRD